VKCVESRAIRGPIALAIAVGLVAAIPSRSTVVFCPFSKQLAYQDASPQQAATGARLKWKARRLFAQDWAVRGFAAEVLWVGTDNKQADDAWVEVGVSHGFGGADVFRFYTAHMTDAGNYEERTYATIFPQIGTRPMAGSLGAVFPRAFDTTFTA
jgi:hypothetical protein